MTDHEWIDLFPSSIEANPHADEAEGGLWRWLDDHGLCRLPHARAKLSRSRVSYCIGLYYPTATVEVLTLITQLAGWHIHIDDEFDAGPTGQDPSACLAAVSECASAFTHQPGATGMTRAVADLWSRISASRSAAWQQRFRSHMTDQLWGYYSETVDRVTGRYLALDEYLEGRREVFAVAPYLDLCEVAVGVDLPDAVHRLPGFRALLTATGDVTALYNDRASADREQAVGGYYHNAVRLLEHHRRCSRGEAVAEVDRMIAERVRRIVEIRRELPHQLACVDFPERTVADALRYADAALDFLRGCLVYSGTSDRYTDVESLPPGAAFVEGFASSGPGRMP